jgi:hypothetical protein
VFGVCGLFLIDILITFRGLWWAAARCLILSISLALIVATQVGSYLPPPELVNH